MSTRDVTFYRWNDMPKEKVNDLLDRRLVTGDRMMLAHVYLKKGCVVPRHQHENEQLTYILEGALRFWIGPRVGGQRRAHGAGNEKRQDRRPRRRGPAHPLARLAQSRSD